MTPSPLLDGVTVLDFASVGPAARCSRALADYGAQVIKIGAPRGIQIQPPYHSYAGQRGMKRVQIDLKAPSGRDAFLRLAAAADVVVESFRPGVVKRLGIGYDDVRKVNRGIVYCSTSGYGQDGPSSQWAGHDINYLAVGGFLACTTPRADGGPPIPGATMADIAGGGMQAAIAILAALHRRAASGEGAYLDVSAADGVLWCMSLWVDQHLATGEEPGPGHDILTGRYAWYDVYAARDGRWLAVGAIEAAFYANLCRALDLSQWIPHQLDDARQEEIRADFRRVFATRDRDDWVAELAPANTCVSPVYSVSELVRDRHFQSRGAFVEARHPQHGSLRQLGPVLAGGERCGSAYQLPDTSVTDTREVLLGLGYTSDEIERLHSEQAVA